MPASILNARRSRPVAFAVPVVMSAAFVALLAACSGSPVSVDRAQEDPPRPVLTPENGTVRTTVVAPTTTASRPDPSDGVPDGDELRDVLLVGDSVLVLLLDDLAGRLRSTLQVDGADCRQLGAAVSGPCGGVPAGTRVASGLEALASTRDRERAAPDAAVFVLANNATITREELDAAMVASSGIDHVWWVNTRIVGFGRQDLNNRLLDELAAQDPRAGVVDWFGASDGEEWLTDNVHPNEAGQEALAALIEDRLRCGCTA